MRCHGGSDPGTFRRKETSDGRRRLRKFSLSMTDGDAPKHPDWEKLNEARGTLHQLGLIGTYANGIGFGNASMRNSGLEFIITGTATGGIPILKEDDYCLVQSFELEKNHVRATGRTKASSESMTHGAIYSADESIRCVLHFHSRKIFDFMLLDGMVPRTKKEVEYGTPEWQSQWIKSFEAALKTTVFLQRDMTKAYSPTGHPLKKPLSKPISCFASSVKNRQAGHTFPFRRKIGSKHLKIVQCPLTK